MKVIFLPDLHVKSNKYFIKGLNDFFNQELYPLIKELQKNNEVVIIQEGDEFDTSSPHWDAWNFLTEHMRLWPKTYLVSGNHTYSIKKGNVSGSLDSLDNVTVYKEPETIKLGSTTFVLLPYPFTQDAKEAYKLYCDQFTESVIAVTHFASEENQFVDEGLNLKLPDGSIVVEGHTHAPDTYTDVYGIKHYTSGVCIPTRKGEEGWQHRLLYMDTETKEFQEVKIDASKYFTYEELKYPEQPKYENSLIVVTDIPKAESKVWRSEYDIPADRIISHKFENDTLSVYTGEENSLEMNFDILSDISEYGKENDSDEKVVKRVVEVVETVKREVV